MDSTVKLLLADVDGTLVTPDKVLTDRAVDAVRRLGEAGILFAVTSGRPPRGMSMLIEPLNLTTPIAAFNGGILVNRDMSVIEQRVIPEELVVPVAELNKSFGLDTWVYRHLTAGQAPEDRRWHFTGTATTAGVTIGCGCTASAAAGFPASTSATARASACQNLLICWRRLRVCTGVERQRSGA